MSDEENLRRNEASLVREAFSAGYKAHMFKAKDDDSGIDGAFDRWHGRERAKP